jgi:ribosomal protein L11 methylase PrmA
MERPVDLVVANLLLPELERLFAPGNAPGSRWYIVSGLKGSDADRFEEHIQSLPLKTVRSETRGIWHTMLLKRFPD